MPRPVRAPAGCAAAARPEWEGLRPLTPRAAYDHINLAAATLRADQPLSPIGKGHLSAVAFGLLGGIGLDLMAAVPAPDLKLTLSTFAAR